MSHGKHGPARNPCGSCPYRRDVPSGVWAAEEYAKLPPYDNDTPFQPSRAFFCHQQNGRLCAGWVGCHDMDNSLALRFAVLHASITAQDAQAAVDYVCPVPLWGSGAEAAAHGMTELESPGIPARRTVDKLRAKQRPRTRKS